MRETRLIMGMPVTVEIVDGTPQDALEDAFDYFEDVDRRFSPYKPDSEVSRFGRGEIGIEEISPELHDVLERSALTKAETAGYFDIKRPDGRFDPSGLVKGWAISTAARRIADAGFADWCVEAGGDIQCHGHNSQGTGWRVGIRNPFSEGEIIKVLQPGDAGVATSGSYVRGAHVYDPHAGSAAGRDIVSLTVVAADIYDADRFATAAFAMGREGIHFVESQPGLDGYSIDRNGVATMTSGFNRLVV